jgi:hypothetical protein
MEQKFGKIDRSRFALDLASAMDQFYIQPGKPWGMDESGGRPFADFVGYLRQWAALAGRDGDAWPPEIRGQTDCRIIHPWQIDQQKLAWATRPFADPDASDGWVMRAKDEGWTMAYQFVAGDDYEVGKRYTLFVRVKCPQPTAAGKAFSCGIYGKDPLPSIEKSVPTESITPDRYQVVEVGTIELQPGHQFWIATVKNSGGYAVSEVRLDCFWLQEAK